jgi:hypothetical protein
VRWSGGPRCCGAWSRRGTSMRSRRLRPGARAGAEPVAGGVAKSGGVLRGARPAPRAGAAGRRGLHGGPTGSTPRWTWTRRRPWSGSCRPSWRPSRRGGTAPAPPQLRQRDGRHGPGRGVGPDAVPPGRGHGHGRPDGRRPGPGGRAGLRGLEVQPRDPGQAPARQRVQAVRLRRGPPGGYPPTTILEDSRTGWSGTAGSGSRATTTAPTPATSPCGTPWSGPRTSPPSGWRSRWAWTGCINVARTLGIRSSLPRYPSVAIGAGEVSLLDMVTAFATFASLGERPEPRFVTHVTDRHGPDRLAGGAPDAAFAISPDVAFLTMDLMRDVVDRGTGTAVRAAGFRGPAAGKTGTTNESADVWFVGVHAEPVGRRLDRHGRAAADHGPGHGRSPGGAGLGSRHAEHPTATAVTGARRQASSGTRSTLRQRGRGQLPHVRRAAPGVLPPRHGLQRSAAPGTSRATTPSATPSATVTTTGGAASGSGSRAPRGTRSATPPAAGHHHPAAHAGRAVAGHGAPGHAAAGYVPRPPLGEPVRRPARPDTSGVGNRP